MPFDRPTLAEIVDRINADFINRIEGVDSLVRRSVLKVMGKVYAGASHLMYAFLDYQADQIFATSADNEGLANIAGEFGLSRAAAVKASGGGEATGTNGTLIPSGSELQTTTSVAYETTADATIASGVADLEFEAVIAGADGNEV